MDESGNVGGSDSLSKLIDRTRVLFVVRIVVQFLVQIWGDAHRSHRQNGHRQQRRDSTTMQD